MTIQFRSGDRVYMEGKGFGHGTIQETGWDNEEGEQLMVLVEWDCCPGVVSGPFVRDLKRSEEISETKNNCIYLS
jgi:hypothetical protein